MAVSQIYLSGGPCDGKTVSANEITGGAVGYIACGGGYYTANTAGKTHKGDIIFDYAGKTKPSPPEPYSVTAPGIHKGWTHLRRSVNHTMPTSLAASRRNTQAALRSLGHAHKVKG